MVKRFKIFWQKYVYKPSPLNIAIVIFLIKMIAQYYANREGDTEGWSGYFLITSIAISAVILVLDFLIQVVFRRYWVTLTLELALLSTIYIYGTWEDRYKEFVIPNNFTGYIIVVYGLKGEPKLPKKTFALNYRIKVPANGIILTSSDMDDDYPNVKIKDESDGITEEDSFGLRLWYCPLPPDKYFCKGKVINYKRWFILRHGGGFSEEEHPNTNTIEFLDEYCSKNVSGK